MGGGKGICPGDKTSRGIGSGPEEVRKEGNHVDVFRVVSVWEGNPCLLSRDTEAMRQSFCQAPYSAGAQATSKPPQRQGGWSLHQQTHGPEASRCPTSIHLQG